MIYKSGFTALVAGVSMAALLSGAALADDVTVQGNVGSRDFVRLDNGKLVASNLLGTSQRDITGLTFSSGSGGNVETTSIKGSGIETTGSLKVGDVATFDGGTQTTGLANVNGVSNTNGFDNVNGIANVNGLSNVNGVSNTNGFDNVNGVANVNGLSNVNGVSNTNGFDNVNGVANVNGLSNVNGVSNTNGFDNVNGIANVNGLSNVNGVSNTNGLSNVNGVANVNGLSNVNGVSNTNGFDNVNGVANVNGLSNVNGVSNTNGWSNVNGVSSVNGLLTVNGASNTNGFVNVNGVSNTNGIDNVNGFANVNGVSNVNGFSNVNGQLNVNGKFTATNGTYVDLGDNIVHGVAGPVVGTDAANKAYVDYNDAVLNNRIKDVRDGVAIALAIQTPDLIAGEKFGVSVNWGNFEGANAFGVGLQGVLGNNLLGAGERVSLTGGVGVSTERSNVGGRAGVQFTW